MALVYFKVEPAFYISNLNDMAWTVEVFGSNGTKHFVATNMDDLIEIVKNMASERNKF